MKVFISYSTHDTELVKEVADSVKSKTELFYWEEAHRPGDEAWPRIFSWIDESDLVLVVITDSTLKRAFSVGQEVGHARKAGKRIIPLVSSEVDLKDLGFLSGITFIPLDVRDPAKGIESLQKELERLENESRELALNQKGSNENGVAALVGLGVLFFLLSR